MPELPEVETVVRGLAPDLIGRKVVSVWTDWPRALDGSEPHLMESALDGRPLQRIFRRAKYICLDFGGIYVVVHLRMTGRLYLSPNRSGDDRWVHVSLGLDDDRYLAFSDSRKFGRVSLCDSLDFLERKLGPEPLEMSDDAFSNLFRGSTRAIKTFLLDQGKIAGIGNIYADEALLRAGIHPLTPVDRIPANRARRLGQTIREVLDAAINYEGASISWYRKPDGSQGESQKHFWAYGRTHQPCKVCGTTIERIVVGQRSTHFCPKCQKKPR